MTAHCPAWCTTDHSNQLAIRQAGDFDPLGCFSHFGSLGQVVTAEDVVEVMRQVDTDDDGNVTGCEIFVLDHDRGLSPDDCEALAAVLLEAAATVRRDALHTV